MNALLHRSVLCVVPRAGRRLSPRRSPESDPAHARRQVKNDQAGRLEIRQGGGLEPGRGQVRRPAVGGKHGIVQQAVDHIPVGQVIVLDMRDKDIRRPALDQLLGL